MYSLVRFANLLKMVAGKAVRKLLERLSTDTR